MRFAVGVMVAVVMLGVLTGCPPVGPERGNVLVAADKEVATLNARAAVVPALKARGKVSLEWKDKDGEHRQTADGVMLFRQGATREGDVLLSGQFGGQEVFQLGLGPTDHWMAMREEQKVAYVGKRGAPVEPGKAPFAAQRVVEVLGITAIKGDAWATKVVDREKVREVQEMRQIPGIMNPKAQYVHRVLEVDPKTGNIVAVRLMQSPLEGNGVEAVAELSDYKWVEDEQGGRVKLADGQELKLPYRIVVTYPAQQARVDLRIESLLVKPEVPGKAFELPDFKGQGLRVERVDR